MESVTVSTLPPTGNGTAEPHFGSTQHGLPVHHDTRDYHAIGTRYARFNKRVATSITKNVGTMTCFWLFTCLAMMSLPATLVLVGWVPKTVSWLPDFVLGLGWIYLVQWIAQSYFQLVLLPALMVGQSIQNSAADARAAKQFEDTEVLRSDVTFLKEMVIELRGIITGKQPAIPAAEMGVTLPCTTQSTPGPVPLSLMTWSQVKTSGKPDHLTSMAH